jgi:PAS domain S-box-containing protein
MTVTHSMVTIYFLYGLAYFALGISILVYPRKGSAFRFADSLWLVAAFGLTHAGHEWLELFHGVRPETAVPAVKFADAALLACSYGFLLLFGLRILVTRIPQRTVFLRLVLFLPAAWAIAVLAGHDRLEAAEVWSRYLLGFPGALLAGWSLLLVHREISPFHDRPIARHLIAAFWSFVAYALFAGLVVPDAPFFPASLINYSLFQNMLGVPVQVFRTLCAVLMTFSMIRFLSVFDTESRAALQRSRDDLERAYSDVEEKVRERTEALTLMSARLQREIDEHRRSENEITLFQSLINQSHDAIFILDAGTGRVLNANVQACTNLQVSCEELLGMHVFDFAVHVADHPSWQAHCVRIREIGSVCYETFLRRRNGDLLPVEVSSRLIEHDSREYVVSIARDIAERRRTQTALEKWADIFTHTRVGVAILGHSAGTMDMMNPAFAAMHGYAMEDLSGRPVENLVAPGYRTLFLGQIGSLVRRKHVVFDVVNIRKDGSRFPAQIDATALNREGSNRYTIINVVDISDRKQVEEVLRYSSQQWRTTFDAIRDMIFVLDRTGTIRRCNQAAVHVFGVPLESLVGRNCRDLMQSDQGARQECPLDRMLRSKNRALAIMQHGSGWFEVIVDPLFSERGDVEGAICIMHDITDRKRTEAELIKAQKLESIGVLAGGIAHDFNNLLTGIMGNISLVLLDQPPGSPVAARLIAAERASIRARDLTQRLITFASGGAPVKRPIPIAAVLKDTVSLALTGSSVQYAFVSSGDDLLITGDEGQLRQVIHNVIANAADAMPRGGTVVISWEPVRPEDDPASPLAGPSVRISVRDEGKGIPQEHLSKVFDPFFTTKQKRSGLGLATSYSIVKNHGGTIAVESRAGQGTMVRIYLPLAPVDRPSADVDQAAGRTVRVLIMDDEKIVRDAASRMLQQMGFEVGLAEDGAEAIRLYRDAKNQSLAYHVVVLDLIVPGGMGGRETIAKLREIDPDVRAIVSSDHGPDPIRENFREHGFHGVVEKPYHFGELTAAINSLMKRTDD